MHWIAESVPSFRILKGIHFICITSQFDNQLTNQACEVHIIGASCNCNHIQYTLKVNIGHSYESMYL